MACARCVGNATSVIRSGAADAAKQQPKPSRKLAGSSAPSSSDRLCSYSPSPDEHLDRVGRALQHGPDDHDSSAEYDASASPEAVVEIGTEWEGDETADALKSDG